MASRRDRSAATGRGAASSCLVFSSVLAMLLTDLTAQQALAWKDEGHMLVAAVARLQMKPETVQKVEGVLALWKPWYKTTSSLETSAVWLDHIACHSPGEYCNFDPQDNLQLFNKWHFCNMPWNPQNISLRLIDKVLPLPYSGADWALPTIYDALQKCQPDKRLLSVDSAEKAAGTGANDHTSEEKERRLAVSASPLREAAATRRRQHRLIHEGTSKSVEKLLQRGLRRRRRPPELQHQEAVTFSQGTAQMPREGKDGRYDLLAESDKVDDEDVAQGSQRNGVPLEGRSSGGAVCSTLSYSLYIRMMIHIYGDIHQPLHASEVFSKAFPTGDYGGNRVYVELPHMDGSKMVPAADKKETKPTYSHNLHGEWDSVFGQYPRHYHEIDSTKLRAEAKRLLQAHPVDGAKLKIYKDFFGIIEESNKMAKEYAYKEFDWKTFNYNSLPYKPTIQYIQGARRIGEERITLGGARLAALLNSIAPYLPKVRAAPASLSPVVAWDVLLREPAAQGGPLKEKHWLLKESSHEQWLSLSKTPAALTHLRKEANSPASDQPDNVLNGKGDFMLSVDEKRKPGNLTGGRQELLGATLPAFDSPLGLGLSAALILLLTSIVALFIAWRQLRMYKRALQVVFQRGEAAAEVSPPAAAAAETGDWHTAAALLGEREGEPRREEHPGGHEGARDDVSATVNEASGFDVTTTARLLTGEREGREMLQAAQTHRR